MVEEGKRAGLSNSSCSCEAEAPWLCRPTRPSSASQQLPSRSSQPNSSTFLGCTPRSFQSTWSTNLATRSTQPWVYSSICSASTAAVCSCAATSVSPPTTGSSLPSSSNYSKAPRAHWRSPAPTQEAGDSSTGCNEIPQILFLFFI